MAGPLVQQYNPRMEEENVLVQQPTGGVPSAHLLRMPPSARIPTGDEKDDLPF